MEGAKSSWFEITTGVRQGCFAIAIPVRGNRLDYEKSDIGW